MKFSNAVIKAEIFTAGLYKTIKFFIETLLTEDFRNHVVKDSFNNKATDVLQILANGPSLRKCLEEIKEGVIEKYDCCMMNYAPNQDEFYLIKPKIFVISDSQFYNPVGKLKDNAIAIYENLNNRVDWDLNVFVQYTWFKDNDYRKKFNNPKLHVIPFHSVLYNGLGVWRNPLMKHDLGSADFGTVLHHAMHIGIQLGYKELHLYGADHSFFDGLCVTEDNVVCRRTTHFYDNGEAKIEPLFHSYSGTVVPYTMAFFTWEFSKWFAGHEKMKAFADYMGVRVINKTKGSYLDTYPRG